MIFASIPVTELKTIAHSGQRPKLATQSLALSHKRRRLRYDTRTECVRSYLLAHYDPNVNQ